MTVIRIIEPDIDPFGELLAIASQTAPACVALAGLLDLYQAACEDDHDRVFDDDHYMLHVKRRDSAGRALVIDIRWFRHDTAAIDALRTLHDACSRQQRHSPASRDLFKQLQAAIARGTT